MRRQRWISPLAGISALLILSGCTTTTRVPVDVAIPPAPPAQAGPPTPINGIVWRDGNYRQIRGVASAVGADSIRIHGRDSAPVVPFGSPGWDRPLPAADTWLLSRGEVGSVAVEKGDKLRTWCAVILFFGGILTYIGVTSGLGSPM